MSYTITKSDGTVLVTIPDGSVDNKQVSGLTFPGANYVGYGSYLNENLLYLLENFASNTAPQTFNLQGQLWFNKYSQSLQVFTDQGYKPVSGVTNASSQPAIAKDGDIWFDTTKNQTFLYNGGEFNLVGPQYNKSQGVSGAIPVVLQDGFNAGVNHNVVQIQIGDSVLATISGDASFTPLNGITGFTTINPGITFSNAFTPTINSNLVGSVIGDVTGNLTGNVTATHLSGTLTGSVIGNLTGDVVANSLRGLLIGNFTSTTGYATNFSSGNAVITGGSITGVNSININSITGTNALITNLTATNLISPAVTITGGSITGLTSLSAITSTIDNLSSSGVNISGGNATGLTNLGASNLTVTNLSSSNAVITGGDINGLTTLTVNKAILVNVSSANAVVTGGSINGTQIGAVTPSLGAFTVLNTSLATVDTLTLTTLKGPVDANIGATTLSAIYAASTANTLQTNFNSYQNTTTANLVTQTTNINTINANLGSFQNRTSANIGVLSNAVVPVGGIILWSGAASAIPTSWALCDGANSTPDLRGRFIMGASATVGNVGTRGGTADAIVVSHTHTASVSDPGHNHTYNYDADAAVRAGSNGGTPFSRTTQNTGTSTTGISVTNTSTGVSGTGQNLPPYYALCYIMRIA